MTLTLFLAYTIATFLFCLTPGPAVLLVTSQAAAHGFGAGVRTVIGILIAEIVYWLISALGLTAVLVASEQAFLVVKCAGAGYLILLGVLTLRGARAKAAKAGLEGDAPARSKFWRAPFVQGAVGQFANPKSILFFLAFLPQFVTPGKTTAFDLLILAIIGMGLDFIVLTAYGWVAARTGALFRDPVKALWRERAAGIAQIAVGGMIGVMRRV